MPWKNLLLVILIAVALTSTFYVNLDALTSFFQKITGYTSVIIYGTVESPQTNATPNPPPLTATVAQPEEETAHTTTETVAIVEQKEEQKEYVNQTILLEVINKTEALKTNLDKLRTSSRAVLNYHSDTNDTENVEKWVNIVMLFNQALSDLGEIQVYAETVKDSATKDDVATIKGMIGDVLKTLDKIIKLIKG